MKKEHSDPIDNIFYDISDKISEPLNNFGITPNMVTILSMITNKITFNLLENKQNKLGCAMILFTYFLDNLDGFLARKYNKYSKIGDYMDHGSDIIFGLSMLYQLYKQNTFDKFKIKLGIYLFFAFMMTVHLGCQEKITDNQNSPTLNYTKTLCKYNSWINYTRYFGPGTTIIVLCLLFLF
jgi:phosphatidylglycerophosphate synthase